MMADTVEAASRTLSKPTKSQIKRMIDRLVDSIVLDGQLVECEITLKDIQLVKESFYKILTGTFHHRIDYPGYDFKDKADDSEGIYPKNPGSE
jgi:membrane-associated HD superfamily phosphohydrolase